MKLLTETIRRQLLENGRRQDTVRGTEDEIDFRPVVKLFDLPPREWTPGYAA
jgi:hypothetical protein